MCKQTTATCLLMHLIASNTGRSTVLQIAVHVWLELHLTDCYTADQEACLPVV